MALLAPSVVQANVKHRHGPGHAPGCWSSRCDRHIAAWLARWLEQHRPPGPEYSGTATYYSPGYCDSTGGGEVTAMGSRVHFGEVANSVLPLGTQIWVEPAIKGRHRFTVEDRFGEPPQPVGRLDVWVPCGDSIPNPLETFRVVR